MTLAVGDGSPATGAPDRTPGAGPVWALRHFTMCLVLSALAFNSQAGRLSPDTKLDLLVNPGGFLRRALQLWDPQGAAGQLQNQAYGYLFPMGPFFWLGHLVGAPSWVVQRLWWSALMAAGYLGVVTLARALALGNEWTRLLAGAAYATSPHVLTLMGANSVEALPMCVAPWAVLPLVLGSRGASPRRTGLACGVAVLFMGGVNAAAVFAAVLPAALWMLTRRPSRHTLTVAGWAVAGVLLASFWWLVPLLLLGKYSPPFLDYIETAATTTQTTSLVETLRGTSDWVPYLFTSGWHAGLLLLTEPALIINSVIVAAIGLAGVALRRNPHRLWLASCLCLGLVAVTFGHESSVGSAFASEARSVLDGPLSPLRNVHKFDLLIRLPLVLGLADVLSRIQWGRTVAERRLSRVLVALVGAIAVLGTATPLTALKLAADDSFSEVPPYWAQAADWLGQHDATGRALVVPASGVADYYWGNSSDEPMQPLATSPWDVRNNIPLVPAGHIRMLDAVEQQLASGTGSSALAAFLQRAGIGYLVVRNDLNYSALRAVPPAVVQASLENSPGLRQVAHFGPVVGSLGTLSTAVDQYLQQSYPAVQLWQVGDSAATDPRVSLSAQSQLTQVSGGPESLLAMQQAGVLGSAPTVLTGQDQAGVVPTRTVLTDGLRRREVNYGGPATDSSATLSVDEQGTLHRKQLDYLPVNGVQHETVAQLVGAASITASSSGADANSYLQTDRSQQPYSAFDGDPQTAWVSRPGVQPVGQWLQITLDNPIPVAQLTLRFTGMGSRPTRIRVTTQNGSVDSAVAFGQTQTLRAPSGTTGFVRLTVLGVDQHDPLDQVGIAEVSIPGVQVSRTLEVPDDLPSGRAVDALVFQASPDGRPSCLLLADEPLCVDGFGRLGEDAAGLDRTFDLSVPATYQLSATATPRPGSALNALIAYSLRSQVSVSASSQSVPDPLDGATSAMDDDPRTGWIASPHDADPTLTLTWKAPRTISMLSMSTLFSLPATRPDTVRITTPHGQREASIDAAGVARFSPIRTNTISLHFSDTAGLRSSYDTSSGTFSSLGIGISELRMPGVPLPVSRSASEDTAVDLRCGSGPSIAVDGTVVTTQVHTTIGALRDLRPVQLQPCGSAAVDLGTGTHRLVMPSSQTWSATTVLLNSGPTSAPADAPAASAPGPTATPTTAPATVIRWGATARSVALGARAIDSVLVVHENTNPGWHATLNGQPLQTIVVDGWQQGYLLPAGPAAQVRLSFGPQRAYAASMILGLLAALAVVAGAMVPGRRAVIGRAGVGYRRSDLALVGLGVVTCGLIGGAVGILAWAGSLALVVAVSAVIRTPTIVRVSAALLAGAGYGVAGVLLLAGHWGDLGYVANNRPEQLLCLVAVGAAISGAAVQQLISRATARQAPGGVAQPPGPASGAVESDARQDDRRARQRES